MKQFKQPNYVRPALDLLKKNALSLSFWAKNHLVQSWIIIAFGRIILSILALGWGFVLAVEGYHFSKAVFVASAVFFLLGFVTYPRPKAGQHRLATFTRRKCCDALLVASSFLAWGGVGNFLPAWSLTSTEGVPKSMPAHAPVLQSAIARTAPGVWHLEKRVEPSKKIKAKSGTLFQKIKTWKQEKVKNAKAKIRQNINRIRKAAQGLGAGKVILLVLASLIIIVLLGPLTAAISCELSCNGQEVAAGLVLVLGVAAIVAIIAWMWVAAVRKERRKKRRAAAAQVETTSAPLPLLSEQTVQVRQPNIRLRLVDKNPKDNDILTVRLGEKVLFDKINPGAVSHWVNFSLNPDESNTLSVHTLYSKEEAAQQLEIYLEDGTSQQHLRVPIEAGKRTVLHFQLTQ